jgi:hypothetical protein
MQGAHCARQRRDVLAKRCQSLPSLLDLAI